MMQRIDYAEKSDRDLLIEIITTVNGNSKLLTDHGQILEDIRARAALDENQLKLLQAAHDERVKENIYCSPPGTIPKTPPLITGIIGGGIPAVLLIIVLIIMKSMGFSF